MARIRKPHFVLFPLMAQGHTIPIIDMARLLAEEGVTISLITTPLNASRFDSIIERGIEKGLQIRLVRIPFPCQQAGLPVGCENLDSLPSRDMLRSFYSALDMLREPLENYIQGLESVPDCIISDKCLSWTSETAEKFDIPRIVFHGMSCFSLLCSHNIKRHECYRFVGSNERFVVPGLPGRVRVEITPAQLPGSFVRLPDLDDLRDKMREAESSAFGVVVNSFEELENGCEEEYGNAIGKRVWCVGPVSLINKAKNDRFERGNASSTPQAQCLGWLDSMEPRSVVYACLGSLCRLVPSQLIELGLALEASGLGFVWVIKTETERHEEVERWLSEERFEKRVRGRGLVIKGWAPQVLILSHKAIGGFLTHCGWNSTIEGVCAGLPMVTWPLFAEQFLNERLVVDVLRIGIPVGVEVPVRWGEEEKLGVLVKKDGIERAVEELMGGGEEGERRRERAKGLGEMARKAMQIGGSSQLNMALLIRDVMEQSKLRRKGSAQP